MTPLERVKELEAKAVDLWGYCPLSREVWGGDFTSLRIIGRLEPDEAALACWLRNLAPQLLTLWEAANRLNEDQNEDLPVMAAVEALNARAAELMGGGE